ncbi:DUF308 domain-containing protein [Nonomuraea salmonea]|uniref:DUF308 domain-containing protein n=1 Tax=Nonomuraea salmonea TaxID=46181 RepID=UPI0031EE0299
MGDITRSWWLLLVRGIAAVIFGILALIWPGLTLLALVIFFGAYALVSGLFRTVRRVPPRGRSRGPG